MLRFVVIKITKFKKVTSLWGSSKANLGLRNYDYKVIKCIYFTIKSSGKTELLTELASVMSNVKTMSKLRFTLPILKLPPD